MTQPAPVSLRANAVSTAMTFQSIGSTTSLLLMGLSLSRFSVTIMFGAFGVAGIVVGVGTFASSYVWALSVTSVGQ